MPRREWTRPFNEIRQTIVERLRDGAAQSSDDLVAQTGLPFEDVISALRLMRHAGEVEFEPEWAGEGRMSAARAIRLTGPKDGGATG